MRIALEDGTEYAHPGRLLFSDLTVDQTTGQVTLRAEVPNPKGDLLPGLYVRVRIEQAQATNAITVPQQAVTRTQQGDTLTVVGADGKLSKRTVKISAAQNNQWVVLDGLKAGEQVMVDGFQKLQMMPPGTPVKAVPWTEAAGRHRPGAGCFRCGRPGCGREVKEPARMAKFFIDRPIFAWVIALFILVVGGVAITQLPIAQYPPVAPPAIVINAAYPGASAQTLEDSVLSVIEREMNGSPGMIYMESVAQADGTGAITISFAPGTDADLAQVDVQNRLARHPAAARGGDAAGGAGRQVALQLPAVHDSFIRQPGLRPDRAGRLRLAQRRARTAARQGHRPGAAVRHRAGHAGLDRPGEAAGLQPVVERRHQRHQGAERASGLGHHR